MKRKAAITTGTNSYALFAKTVKRGLFLVSLFFILFFGFEHNNAMQFEDDYFRRLHFLLNHIYNFSSIARNTFFPQ